MLKDKKNFFARLKGMVMIGNKENDELELEETVETELTDENITNEEAAPVCGALAAWNLLIAIAKNLNLDLTTLQNIKVKDA
jgi:type VI protein secretion system component VasF